MKILVLGGTGAMGIPLSEVLLKEDNEVVVTTRRKAFPVNGVKVMVGDAKNIFFLRQLLRIKWDAIVDFMDYATFEFIDRYQLLLDSTDHYIFLSSSRVYANSGLPLVETFPRLYDISQDVDYLMSDEYALHKAREENLLIHSGKSNFTIIRPYITYGPMRLQLGVLEKELWLYRLMQGRTILFSEDISCHFTTMTYASDVASCIVRLVHNPKAFGEIFHIATTQTIQWKEVLDIYLSTYKTHTGKEPKVRLLDKAINLTSDIGQYQVKYDRYYDRAFDNSKLMNVIGNFEFMDVRQGLQNCLTSFLKDPEFLYFPKDEEDIRNKITGEKFNFNEVRGKKKKLILVARKILHL